MLLLLSLVLPTTATAAGQTSWMASRDGQGKGLCTANSSLIVIANEWMHLLRGFVCQTTNLWVSIYNSGPRDAAPAPASFAPRVVATHFAVCSCSFCCFCRCWCHCSHCPTATLHHSWIPAPPPTPIPARWCCSCVSLQGVFMLFVICYLPFRNCVLAMNWLQTTFPFWPLYGAHSTNGRA